MPMAWTKAFVATLLFTVAITGSRAQSVESDSAGTSLTCLSSLPPLALKTNLLYDAVLVPTIGIEVSVYGPWTVSLDWFYTWISSNRHHRYWQGYGGYIGVRHYWGEQPFTGHHAGLYALGLTYDVEWGGRGYQAAKFGWGGGVEYGYSLPVSSRLNLDFSIGLGFQDGEYKEYLPADDNTGHYLWQSTRKRHWWGPTKAEVSLKWILGPLKVKKGDGR